MCTWIFDHYPYLFHFAIRCFITEDNIYSVINRASLTPSNRVLLEKLTDYSASEKIPEFYGAQWSIIAFTKNPPPVPTQSQINPVHAPHPTCWRPALTLSPIYPCIFQVVSFPQVYPPEPCKNRLSPPFMLRAQPVSFLITRIQVFKLIVIYSSPFSRYTLPLKPKFLPPYPILDHPQAAFNTQCRGTSFTPIQNNRQNYNTVS